jgi:hypothetical protein
MNIFGYSFVVSCAYEYIRILIRQIFCHTNIFGYSFVREKRYSLHTGKPNTNDFSVTCEKYLKTSDIKLSFSEIAQMGNWKLKTW